MYVCTYVCINVFNYLILFKKFPKRKIIAINSKCWSLLVNKQYNIMSIKWKTIINCIPLSLTVHYNSVLLNCF